MSRPTLFRSLLALLALVSCQAEPLSQDQADLEQRLAGLASLHRPCREPEPGDWLASHEETGQTFAEYVAADPVRSAPPREVLYVQPLGEFGPEHLRVLERTVEFLGLYFDSTVQTLDSIGLDAIPGSAQREHGGSLQVLSTYVLNELLAPNLPDDAAAMLALSSADLWPGRGWNFVFGQASLRKRVGVWSMYRNGDPTESAASFRTCLLRTLKTATHETGHMFSMEHCIAHECNLCGSNSLSESDRKPLWLCPPCLAKLVHATGADPIARYRKLAAFCDRNGLENEARFYNESIELLR